MDKLRPYDWEQFNDSYSFHALGLQERTKISEISSLRIESEFEFFFIKKSEDQKLVHLLLESMSPSMNNSSEERLF